MPSFPDRPLVSCILPVHNGAAFVAEALFSVINQDYSPLEVILVDDGSTDDSVSIAKGFPSVRLIEQENLGNAVARNRGINESRGGYLAFLDQDDIWTTDNVSTQVAHMEANPDLAFCYGLTEFFLQQQPSPAWFQDKLLKGTHSGFGPGVLLARRATFDQVGRFNEDLSTTSDVEWFVQAMELGVAYAVVPRLVLRKRVHGAAQSSKTQVYHPELLRILRRSIARRRENT